MVSSLAQLYGVLHCSGLLLSFMMIIRGGCVEDKVIFKIKNENGTEEDLLVIHREAVTVDELISIGRELGCVE